MGVGGQLHAPAALPPGKRPGTHFTGGWVGPQGRSGRVRKISPPPGFDPRTVQPVASRYADWAIPAHLLWRYPLKWKIYNILIPSIKFPFILPPKPYDVREKVC
jgi:hypothetical protein